MAGRRIRRSSRRIVRLPIRAVRAPASGGSRTAQFGEESVEPPVALWTDNADLLAPVLMAGEGLAIQPEFLVWRELREGTLEVAMPDWTPPPLALHLIMPPSPFRPLRVQVVIDHLAAALAKAPWAG